MSDYYTSEAEDDEPTERHSPSPPTPPPEYETEDAEQEQQQPDNEDPSQQSELVLPHDEDEDEDPIEHELYGDDDGDNYGAEFDYSAINESFNFRVEYFLSHTKIQQSVGRKSVEACVIVDAGCRVKELYGQLSSQERNGHMLTEYVNIMGALPLVLFSPPNLRRIMCCHIHGTAANAALTGEKLYNKFLKIQREIGRDYENSMPMSLHADLPSGESIRDLWNKFILLTFKEDPKNVSLKSVDFINWRYVIILLTQ